MTYVHAWIEAAKAAAEKKAAVAAFPMKSAQLVGVWEHGDAVDLQIGSNTVIRRTRLNFDFETLGARACADASNENQGHPGKRADFIIQGYVHFIGLGQWAVEYMERTHGKPGQVRRA